MKTKSKKNISIVFLITLLFSAPIYAQNLETAISYTRGEQFDSAKDSFEALIKSQPNNGDVYFYYGQNYLFEYYSDTVYTSKSVAMNEAKKIFEKGIEMDANNPLCYVGLGKVYLMGNDITNAEKYFADAQSKFPSKTNKTSTILPEKQAWTLAKIAESYIVIQRKKNVTKALQLLEKAVELDGKNAEIYLIYGDAFLENNDGSNAISQYKMAQELNQKSPSAKLRLGNLWIRARNWSEAISYYKEAIGIDSTFAPAYLELGILYSKASQLDLSMQNFKKYLEISTNVSAKIKYVNVLIESQKYKEAINQLNEIAQTDTSRNDLNRAFAYCYFETADYPMALKYISKFFSRAIPEKIIVSDHVYYGKILSKNGQDSLAIIKYFEALSIDSSQTDVFSEIGQSYSKLKKYDKSAVYYEKKIALGKASLADYYRLGLVYYNLKNWVKADETYKYITDSKPEYMNGKSYYWRGLVNSNIDSTSITWQAKPYFESYIEMVKNDSVKYAKDLIICYDYLASYYFLGPNKDFCNAIMFWEKIIALDPKNERALGLLKDTKGKCPNKK